MATPEDVLNAIKEVNSRPASDQPQPTLSFSEMISQAFANTPASAAQFGSDIVQPFLNPVETADSIISLGKGIVQLAIPGEQGDEKTARAVGAYFVDRYGSLEDAKRTFAADPVGFLGDASVVITGGAGLAARAPMVTGKVAATVDKVRKVGEKIDPINAAVSTAKVGGKLASVGVPALVGLSTGTSGDSLRQAYSAGREGGARQEALTENMRGEVDPSEVVDEAREAFQTMRQQTRSDFQQSKAALDLEQTPIDFFPVAQAIEDLGESFNYKGFTELSSAGQTKMRELKILLNKFQSNEAVQTAYGLDVLKRAIDDLYPRDINPGNEAVVVQRARDIVKTAILEQAPDYNKVMRPYEQARRLEIEMQKALSLGNNAAADTALRKLQSVMRDNVNANFGGRLRLVEKLEKAGDALLIPKVAGQDLQAVAPRGIGRVAGGSAAIASLQNPLTLAALPFTSPRLMGETALAAGAGVRKLNEAQNRLLNKAPVVRAGLESAAQNLDIPSSLRRSRGVGMVERVASEEERQLQDLLQSLNINQAQIVQ